MSAAGTKDLTRKKAQRGFSLSSAKKRGTEYYGKRGKSNLYGRGKTVLFLVVPCYNEEEVIVSSAEELENKLSSLGKEGRISGRSRIVLTLLVFIVFIRQHQTNELLTYLLYKAVSFALMFGMEAVSGVFMPRMLITFYIMQACGGLAALFFCPERSRAVSWVLLFYFLVQIFFIQVIIANRQASNSLDIVYAGQVLSKIDVYEEETGVKVTNIAATEDLYSTDLYPQVHYANGEVNRRNYGWNTRSFLVYECGDYSRFELAEMDPDVYNLYFAGRDWDEFNADEQIIIEGGTCYICVF